jgi:tRNA (cmo5U34)-methyltransferase
MAQYPEQKHPFLDMIRRQRAKVVAAAEMEAVAMSDNSTPHRAAKYDAEILRTVPFYRQFHTETIDLVRTLLLEVSVWLDTGCGTGYLAEQALPLFPGTRFLLADPAQAMLDLARARLARFPSGRVRFLDAVGSEGLVGVIPETPQVISAIQSHHYGGEEARRLATNVCFRLLKPGGVYVTFENIRPDTPRGIEIGLDRWLRFQREAGRSARAVQEHRSRFDRNYFPITVCEHLELLRTTGFTTVEVFWLTHMQAGFYGIK